MKEISTPRIKDAQWRELQQDISTRLAADARTTTQWDQTHEILQGQAGTEEGRKEVLSRRQEAGERKLAKTESPKPQLGGKSAGLHIGIMNKRYCSKRFSS